MRKIKILYIIDKMVPAGAQKHLLEVLKNIDRTRFEPQLVCLLYGGELIDEIEALGISYKIYGLKRLYSPSGLRGTFKLSRFIKKEKFDIVHNYLFAASVFGTIAAKFAGTKTIITSRRGTGMLREGKWQHMLAYRITNRWVDKIVCVSNAVREVIKRKEKVRDDKLEVIYNGVDLKSSPVREFASSQIKKSLKIKEDEFVVSMVANFSWIKGHKEFIEAAKLVLKEMPNTKFLLIGDGPLKFSLQLKAQSSKLRDKVLFLGRRMDIPELLSIMDVSVNASYSEGMSNTILESMVAGVPVVATATDGNLETVVGGSTGILVSPKDVEAMAEAIIKILKDKELARRMGENAKQVAAGKFSSQKMTRTMEGLYQRLLEPKIAFIMPQFPRYDETFISRELLELHKSGLNLHIFSLKHSEDEIVHKEVEPLLRRTINVNFIFSIKLIWAQVYFILTHPAKYLSAFLSIFKLLYKSPNYLLKAIAVFPKSVYFAKLSKALRIAHIHAQWATTPTVSAKVMNRLTGIPFSFSGHAHDIYADTVGLKEKIKEAKFVTTCTADNKRYLLELMGGRKLEDKIVVNYHGVDIDKLRSIQSSKLKGKDKDSKLKILSVGSLLPCKGFEVLIEACRILKDKGVDFECVIAGGGQLENSLKSQVISHKLRKQVKLTGYITQEELIPLYQRADVFALPVRLDIHWGIPNVLLEAMAVGLPVITTHLPSMPELIKDGNNGFIIPERNPQTLADILMRLHKDGSLRKKIGANARKTVEEKFDVKKNVIELKEIFNRACAIKRSKNRLTVLAYHRISDDYQDSYTCVNALDFKKQMHFLKSHSFKTISLDDAYEFIMARKEIPKKSILITFDDGFKDNYTIAYPILRRYNFKATILLTAGKIGKDKDYLNWTEVKQMSLDGISFGSHTLTHPNLCSLSPDEIKRELIESKSLIEQKIKKKVNFLCYPYGYFNQDTKLLAKQAGYKGAFSVLPGYNREGADLYEFKRIEVGSNDSLLRFRAKLFGAYLPLQRYMYKQKILKRIEASSRRNGRANILYVIWALGLGGAERVVISLAKGLDRAKFNPVICCLNDKGEFADELERIGIKVIALNKKGKFDLSVIRKIASLIKQYKIDIVHTHLWGANFWGRIGAKKAGVKCIIANEHGIEAWRTPLHFMLDRFLAPYTDRIIFVSESAKNLYIEKTGIDRDRCTVIYNGIDLDKFNNNLDKNRLRKELGIGRDDFVVTIIGRVVEGKGHQYLFEALSRLNGSRPKIKCLVVGDGPLLQSHKSQVTSYKLDDEVVFMGLRRDIPEILAATDLMVLPSSKEAMPISILEAMAQGKAVVATKVGGIPELVQDGVTGLLIEPASAEGLTLAIKELSTNRDKLRTLGVNSRKMVEEGFSIKKTVHKIEELYQDCLKK